MEMKREVTKLIAKIEFYQMACKITSQRESDWEWSPEDEELEKAFDRAYEKEYRLLQECSEELEKVTNGRITKDVAEKMISEQPEKVKAILAKQI